MTEAVIIALDGQAGLTALVLAHPHSFAMIDLLVHDTSGHTGRTRWVGPVYPAPGDAQLLYALYPLLPEEGS
jgi:hypothetical protein